MPHVIWKFELELGSCEASIPEGFVPISVQYQHGQLTLWALVNTSAQRKTYLFTTYATGEEMDVAAAAAIRNGDRIHLATVQQPPYKRFVWHIFYDRLPIA